MDIAFAQLPLLTTTHILVLEMVPSSSLKLTVGDGKIALVSAQASPFQIFSVCGAVWLGFFVAMVSMYQAFSLISAIDGRLIFM